MGSHEGHDPYCICWSGKDSVGRVRIPAHRLQNDGLRLSQWQKHGVGYIKTVQQYTTSLLDSSVLVLVSLPIAEKGLEERVDSFRADSRKLILRVHLQVTSLARSCKIRNWTNSFYCTQAHHAILDPIEGRFAKGMHLRIKQYYSKDMAILYIIYVF